MSGEVIHYNPNGAQPARQAHMLPQSLADASRIAEMIAASNLFGYKTKEQAFSLMLLADAEGLHPAAAARDYHIIDGKPSLRADAMLARYMAAGGKIKWLKREPDCASAEFTHPASGTFAVTWDAARATLAGFWNKATWKKHPLQMLSARVISEGVRASFPGVVSGVYTPEEVMDFEPSAAPPRAGAPAIAPPREAEATAAGAVNANDAAPVASYASVNEDGEEVDQTTQPEWPILESEMEAFSTREDLKAWWLSPEKKALKRARPHLMRAFYRFAYLPRLEDLAETVEWTDEAGARG